LKQLHKRKELEMDITRENYESWFVDYLEGNLDENVVDRFIEFLQENPDLKEELKLFESVTAVSEELSFHSKSKLYKSKYDLEDEFNEAAIAEIEGDLNVEEKASFEKYLAIHPEKQSDRELFEKTILIADKNIRFSNKEGLYKKSGRKVFLLWSGRVAAVLILALAIFSLINRTPETPVTDNQFAKVEQQNEQKTEIQESVTEKSNVSVSVETHENKVTPEPFKKENKILPKKEIQSIPEETKVGTIPENLIAERVPLEVPETLLLLTASLDVPSPHADMAVMTIVYPDYIPDDEHLLTDNLRGKISLQKITRAGLNLVANLSNDRFNYQTNSEGKVTEYNYESRLLAFSIPATHPSDGE